MTRFVALLCLLIITLPLPLFAAEDASLQQRDWMVGLVEGLGWSFGLPDEPVDEDYLRILSGGRTFRYEAEALCHPDDLVSVKSYRAYGYCSGEGWLSGISRPTSAHLKILVPLPGTYQATVRMRRPGHHIQIGENFFSADAGEMFENVVLGEVNLTAGWHDVTLRLPPDGAVDYLELVAPQIKPIAPAGGWRPDAPLRSSDLATTVTQLLALEAWLLPNDEVVVLQAEEAKLSAGAGITTIRHLGEPEGGAWVRAGNLAGRVSLVLEVAPGVYRLTARGMGDRPLRLEIPGRLQREVAFKPYLDDVDLGYYHLESNKQRLTIDLPPRSGIDRVRLAGYRAAAHDFLHLTGVAQQDGPVKVAQLDALLALLTVLAEPR